MIGMGRHAGVECRINAAVHTVNQAQRTRFLETIGDHFDGVLAGRAFAVWGLSFKPRTDDVREAPAVAIVRSLLASGAAVTGYDPAASATFRRAVPGVRIADDMYEALDGADALILCTEWSEFRNPDLEQVRRRLSAPVVFDGRNLWSPDRMRERGFTYRSIGRPPVLPATTAACPTA